MGADQVAAIRPAIAELAAAAEAREDGYEHLCASFSVPGKPKAWAEVVPGSVNLAFPRAELPLSFIAAQGLSLPGARVVSFKPGLYATLAHDPCAPSVLARFVDAALVALHGLDAESYEVDVTFKRVL